MDTQDRFSDDLISVAALQGFIGNWADALRAAVYDHEKIKVLDAATSTADEFTRRGAPITGTLFKLVTAVLGTEILDGKKITTH